MNYCALKNSYQQQQHLEEKTSSTAFRSDSVTPASTIYHRLHRGTRRGAKSRRIYIASFVSIVALLFVVINGYRFVGMFRYWQRNSHLRQEYAAEVERLEEKQAEMKKTIDRLENSALVIERLARQMGYVKPGETVYKLPSQPNGVTPSP